MAETIDPPVALPPASHGKKITIAGVFAVVIAAGVVGGVSLRTNSAAAAATDAQPASYPLSVHYEQVDGQQTVVCDPTSAKAWSDGRGGVAVKVFMNGPGTIDVDLGGTHLAQQVTKHDMGARFDAPIASPNNWVVIYADNRHSMGVCQVMPISQ